MGMLGDLLSQILPISIISVPPSLQAIGLYLSICNIIYGLEAISYPCGVLPAQRQTLLLTDASSEIASLANLLMPTALASSSRWHLFPHLAYQASAFGLAGWLFYYGLSHTCDWAA